MRTTQELHIQLDILLQKVSSNWNKNFLPQEKDFFINREITKFIKQRISPQSNSKRLSTFDTLKRIQDLNCLFRTVPRDIVTNQKEAIFELPFDFLYCISNEVDVKNVCNSKPITYENKNIYNKSIKPFNASAPITSGVLNITINAVVTPLFNTATLPPQYLPQDNIEDYKKLFIYNNALLILIEQNLPKEVEFKYNKLKGVIEFRSTVPYTLSWVINGVVQTVTETTNVIKVVKDSTNLISNLEFIDEEFKTQIKASFLSSSKGKNLKGFLRQDSIIVQSEPSVIAKTAYLTYLCKPRKVDVLLNCDSDLPDEILDEVIANTAESLKAVISSDTYEKYAQNNLLIE